MNLFPFEALVAALVSLFIFIQPILGQEGGQLSTTVTNFDSGIAYFPSYCNSSGMASCIGSWWDTTLSDGSGSVIKTSAGPSSTFHNAPTWLRYYFYGTKVDIHGLLDVQGSMLIVQLDDSMMMVNTSSGYDGSSMSSKPLASMTSLENDTIHSLSIGWCANENTNASSGLPYAHSFAYFSHLNIENFREANVGSLSASPNTSSVSSDDASSMNRGQKVGVALGSIAGGFAIFAAIIIALRRSRRFHLFPRLAHWWGRDSRDVEVIISSESLRRTDSIFDYDFKPRPHTSLLPSYAPPSDGSGIISSGSRNNLKSSKEFDLELGAIEYDPFKADSSMDHSQSEASLISPQKDEIIHNSKLRVATRDSVLHLGEVTRIRQKLTAEPELSSIPLTPFVVEKASIIRTQTPSIVSAASTNNSALPNPASSSDNKRKTVSSPSSSIKSISQPSTTSSAKKARRSKSIVSRLPTPNWSQAQQFDLSSTSTLPQPPLPVHTHASAPLDGRPSFDTFSITSRSVPPPYALYPI